MKNSTLKTIIVFLLISATCFSFASCKKNKDIPFTKMSDESTSLNEEAGTVTYTKETNGLTLKVTIPKEVPYGESFVCVTEITNNTDDLVQYTVPASDEKAGKLIDVEIGTARKKFTNRTTFLKGYDTALQNLDLKPHETFGEEITFLPSYHIKGSGLNIAGNGENFSVGEYSGKAVFYWNTETGGFRDKNLTLKFTVKIIEKSQ